MNNGKILIVDDDTNICELLRLYIEKEGFSTAIANDGVQALEVFNKEQPNLVLLDIMMPKLDGWQVCKEIRKESKTPIIMLTAKAEEQDELLGFELGVDEYIAKPFSPKILVARVDAILRRTNKSVTESIMKVGNIEVDKLAHIVKVCDKVIDLSFKEFELLVYFMENTGIALSRENILNAVWSYDYFGDARTIDTHVKKLRAKLTADADYIKTIWGLGYKMEV